MISQLVTRIRKSADVRKTEIVKAAIRLAAEIGPDRLTTERLAKDVGISQPGIFRHFPTKDDIWQAVAQYIGDLLQEKAGISDDATLAPMDQLHRSVISHLGFIKVNPAIPAILFSRELHAGNEKMRLFFASLMSSRHQGLSKLIAAEIAAGRFDGSLDPDDAAYLVLALIQGLAMRWSLNARNFDLVEEGRRLLDIQLNGFRIEDG